MNQDEDDDIYEGKYENGHWEWNEKENALQFISDLPPSEEEFAEVSKTIIRSVEFKDDIDLWEQQRFRKRLQRKTTEDDVVTLQDVKDVVLFTAHVSILSPAVINMFHLPTTERFLRALILYCQYHLQILDIMNMRALELDAKIRTKNSYKIESKYRADLEDLRILVAKEYCIILLGEEEFSKYHHMGSKKMMSLSKKDAILIDTVMRIAIQIVWIALGRKHFNQIELEVNRIFKSDIYNSAEHTLGTNYLAKMNAQERFVLVGQCVQPKKKLNTNSPVMNEVYCERNIDFRLFGLGTTKYSGLNARLRYLECFLSQPENNFCQLGITLGIIGLPRTTFDIMLRMIRTGTTGTSISSTRQSSSRISRTSRVSYKSNTSAVPQKLYPDIHLPSSGDMADLIAEHFPYETLEKFPINDEQRLKWLKHRAERRSQKRKVGFNKLNKK